MGTTWYDIAALGRCMMTWIKHHPLMRFVLRVIRSPLKKPVGHGGHFKEQLLGLVKMVALCEKDAVNLCFFPAVFNGWHNDLFNPWVDKNEQWEQVVMYKMALDVLVCIYVYVYIYILYADMHIYIYMYHASRYQESLRISGGMALQRAWWNKVLADLQ